jgi:hypothetical protein
MSQEHMQEISAAVREVLKRSVVDPDFRQLAVNDSSAAIAKVAPSLTASYKLKFVDNFGSNHKVIALPDPITDASLLTEEDLEQVAGGAAGCTASSCAITSAEA